MLCVEDPGTTVCELWSCHRTDTQKRKTGTHLGIMDRNTAPGVWLSLPIMVWSSHNMRKVTQPTCTCQHTQVTTSVRKQKSCLRPGSHFCLLSTKLEVQGAGVATNSSTPFVAPTRGSSGPLKGRRTGSTSVPSASKHLSSNQLPKVQQRTQPRLKAPKQGSPRRE